MNYVCNTVITEPHYLITHNNAESPVGKLKIEFSTKVVKLLNE